MFHHMVMFRFKDDTTEDEIDAITAGLAALPSQIDVLGNYRFGPDAGITEGSWDYGVAADFTDEGHYPEYSSHPAHVAVFKERIAPVVEEIARVQFRS